MATWSFDMEEFAALWYGPANDRMLYPLDYLSRFSHVNERDRHWAAVRREYSEHGRLSWNEADLLRRAFTVLTAPEVWAEIHGVSDESGPIRVAAARHDRHAAQALQFTRETRIELTITTAEQLPARLLALLPPVPPGTRPTQTFAAADLHPDNHPTLHYTGETTPLQRYRRLVRRPATGAGVITVFRGPRHLGNKRPRKVGTMRWYDIEDDGRYLETGTRTRTVRPAEPLALQAALTRLLDHASTEYREYLEDTGDYPNPGAPAPSTPEPADGRT
ncbi:ESX secretion-associated protein EspG [Nocardia sp. CDC159]|uniref:ESX secretion-associated protein EspG n=1 Tax=Nocardia pulmonis TaxID=2951408 RepID=A0A9X2E8A8_9NOCA|nr:MULTISPECIES: ESX secretion-associated protein EspG [Nocardia]MCM6775430.1 ESX secretion-associated protein EspG [Nocardia pulmonis]MCM6787836.1 ESX secretion-associated protein EspG [Nocardia sp. CDC159]